MKIVESIHSGLLLYHGTTPQKARSIVAASFTPRGSNNTFGKPISFGAFKPFSVGDLDLDSVDRMLIDGYHRAQAAKLRGASTIPAYSGVNPDPNWRPED